MQTTTHHGYTVVESGRYLEPHDLTRLVQESSAVGDYDDSRDVPGSSYLWIGKDHHLNRDEVAQLVEHLQEWLATGRLLPPE